jgi:hypothetical protein
MKSFSFDLREILRRSDMDIAATGLAIGRIQCDAFCDQIGMIFAFTTSQIIDRLAFFCGQRDDDRSRFTGRIFELDKKNLMPLCP